MKYLSLFSGIGGFEYGLEQSKYEFENVGFSEIDKYAKSIYTRHFPRHKDLGDASEIDPNEIEDFELLVGGFPCQAFSLSGKRKGFDDTRGTLFFEIARICEAKRPRYLLLENVKGLLSHDGGRTFKTMLGILAELGYDVEWTVLNSKSFGVAQNRERVYIKGYFRAKCGGEILSQERDSRKTDSELNNGIQTLHDGRQSSKIYGVDGCSPTICGNGGGMGAKTGLYKIQKVGNLSNTNHNGKNVYSKDGISPTLCSGSVPKNRLNILELPDDRELKSVKFNRQVRKRVHDADYDELSEFLRYHKKAADATLKSISEALDVKHSEVEHWFRTDEYFCPPPPEVWADLKMLLNIKDDKYDAFITEFELVDGVFEMDKRAYDVDGLSPCLNTKGEALAKINVVGNLSDTGHHGENVVRVDESPSTLTSSNYKHPLKILEESPKVNVVGNINPNKPHQSGDVYGTDGVCRTLTATDNSHPVNILEEDHKLKLKTNTKKGYDEVTTGDGVRLCHPSSTKARGRTQKGQTGALSTQADWGTVDRDYRIRKLTPKECERLQAFPDDWTKYGKDDEPISDTQRYKCLGNAVTTSVITWLANTMFRGYFEAKS